MEKVAIHTLGCKVNQYESEGILELFRNEGYQVVDFDDFANVYIINTCSVTNIADKKSRQMINKAKKSNQDAIIVAMGCYAQASPEEVSKINGVDLIIGSNNKTHILEYIHEFKISGMQINWVNDIMQTREFEEFPFATVKEKTRAYIKIQDGCNQYCSYCIIPYTRGTIRSRSLDEIIKEVQKLSHDGYEEVVLTGIHIESYGKDLKNGNDLVMVINSISQIEGIKRIRLGSVDPTLISRDFLERLKSDKLCHHFHLSLQSGCDQTLKRMNRKYSTSQFKESVNLLRSRYPDAAFSTDIIVGFPGETNEEFETTMNFAKEMQFSKIHVFKFSPRKGTKAANFPNQIDSKTKDYRSKSLIELGNELQKEFNNKFVGTVQEVLIEKKSDECKLYEGLTRNYIRVLFEANEDLIGKSINVKLNESIKDYILGNIENIKI